jgi:hypothetical protein
MKYNQAYSDDKDMEVAEEKTLIEKEDYKFSCMRATVGQSVND